MANKPVRKKDSKQSRFKYVYSPDMCEDLIKFMSEGNSFAAWCASRNIPAPVAYRWVQEEDKDEFFEAKRIGEEKLQKWWEDVGRAGMIGKIKGFQSAVWIFTMKNRYNWTDKNEVTESKEKRKIQAMTDKEITDAVKRIKKLGQKAEDK